MGYDLCLLIPHRIIVVNFLSAANSVLIDKIMFENSLHVFSVWSKLQDYCACVVGFRGYRESFLSYFVMNSGCLSQSRWNARGF